MLMHKISGNEDFSVDLKNILNDLPCNLYTSMSRNDQAISRIFHLLKYKLFPSSTNAKKTS